MFGMFGHHNIVPRHERKDFAFDASLLAAWDAGAKVVRSLRKDRKENPHLRGWASMREMEAIRSAVHGVPSYSEARHLTDIVNALMVKLQNR